MEFEFESIFKNLKEKISLLIIFNNECLFYKLKLCKINFIMLFIIANKFKIKILLFHNIFTFNNIINGFTFIEIFSNFFPLSIY